MYLVEGTPPKEQWDKDWLATSDVSPIAESKMSLIKAWAPYVIVALVLVITRIPQLGIKEILNNNKEALKITFDRIPEREELDPEIKEQLVIEYYSK